MVPVPLRSVIKLRFRSRYGKKIPVRILRFRFTGVSDLVFGSTFLYAEVMLDPDEALMLIRILEFKKIFI
jgi:hypothetical protein